jgi:hypothetical protein
VSNKQQQRSKILLVFANKIIDENEIDNKNTINYNYNNNNTQDNEYDDGTTGTAGINTTSTDSTTNPTTPASSTSSSGALSEVEKLRQQAKKLREEVVDMRLTIQEDAEMKEAKRIAKVDMWLNHLLINQTVGGIEQLNTVEHVLDLLITNRYSPEQVYQIFERLCTTTSIRGRDSIASNQLLQLLITAVGKMDEIERDDNSNKRWSQIVERTLHKRLFAMEWGINLEKLNGDND